MYTVNGVTYMEGKKHEDKLHGDLPCEVFVDKLDEWFSGKIVFRQDEALIHTKLVFTSFTVIYYVHNQLAKELYTEKNVTITVPNLVRDQIGVLNQLVESIEDKCPQDMLCVQESKVKSDRIRLIKTPELMEMIEKLEKTAVLSSKSGIPSATKHHSMLDLPVPEETQFVSKSQWQTVSVTVVDDAAVAAIVEEEQVDYPKQYKKKQESQVIYMMML